MAFYCSDCRNTFTKPYWQDHTDLVEYWGFRSSEITHSTAHCPECGNEDFTELQDNEE